MSAFIDASMHRSTMISTCWWGGGGQARSLHPTPLAQNARSSMKIFNYDRKTLLNHMSHFDLCIADVGSG